MTLLSRRRLLAATGAAAVLPTFALQAVAQERRFEPRPAGWRSFEIVTRVEIPVTSGAARVWLPVPSVDDSWQRSGASDFKTNGTASMQVDPAYGARFLQVDFPASQAAPYVELTSRFDTRDRPWSAR